MRWEIEDEDDDEDEEESWFASAVQTALERRAPFRKRDG
jgi:hypothetical protein